MSPQETLFRLARGQRRIILPGRAIPAKLWSIRHPRSWGRIVGRGSVGWAEGWRVQLAADPPRRSRSALHQTGRAQEGGRKERNPPAGPAVLHPPAGGAGGTVDHPPPHPNPRSTPPCGAGGGGHGTQCRMPYRGKEGSPGGPNPTLARGFPGAPPSNHCAHLFDINMWCGCITSSWDDPCFGNHR